MPAPIRWNGCTIELLQGDITTLAVDTIVNAANAGLLGGGGVDGAIHRRGGPAILEECRRIIAKIGHLPTGQAVLTTGGMLPAKHVIHTVGPVYDDDPAAAPRLLADAYRNSLALARQHGLKSVAFCCISTGVYGYPKPDACRLALATVKADLVQHAGLERVVFCTFGAEDYRLYEEVLAEMA